MMAIGVEIARPKSACRPGRFERRVVDATNGVRGSGYRAFLRSTFATAIQRSSRFRSSRAGSSVLVFLCQAPSINPSGASSAPKAWAGSTSMSANCCARKLNWPLFFENDANLSALAEQWFYLS